MTAARLEENRRVAARVAARAELRDVRLLSTSARTVDLPEPGAALRYTYESTPAVDHDPDANAIVVRLTVKIAINMATEAEPSQSEPLVAELDIEMGSLYELRMRDGDAPPTEAELVALADSTGQLALYPYVREYVRDLTGRLGLPALTLNTWRIPVGPEEL